MTEKLNLLFVHGAWHGAWCWAEVIALAKSRGHNADAIDLPGHGRRQNETATLANYAAATAAAIDTFDGEVVLIGHSMGGIAISTGAEINPDRIRGLIYLSAAAPLNGDTVGTAVGNERSSETQGYVGILPDGRFYIHPEGLKPLLYHDCSDAQIELARLLLMPQATEPVGAVMHLSAEKFGRLRKSYIVCEDDRTISPVAQRKMIARTGINVTRSLQTSHSPFFSAPAALLEAIEALA